ncbi:hypothetical protein LT989_10740 [Citrobacter portucalensis]|uniref:hypothetical protein n=1 Tax=Citrobacter freundii complex TaxID=1344959 RepID=UPI000F8C4B30|nr:MULTISPECIES: hypothetical protein [Citrobacter freundii complex]MBJ9293452.1 hypothetical protein [Citrobacter werkmanii]MEB0790608.1 hypothetical protein [Citrobacter portucalensis]MEB0874310.1 hypothetical protein [Citrobacter portucalensis]RUR35954.1 hypothetical protein EKO26_23940 [Citrobacter portucalensis]UHD39070.1 hypothetical protein LT989_10740 [Citrobacter portucalensis]
MNSLPDDYFLDADDELVDFLEKQGEDCIREIHQSNALNKENGQKLLSILIAGVGSSFLLLTQRTGFDYLTAGMSVFLVYWALCAAYLVRRVLAVRMRAITSSTPNSLYSEGYKGFGDDDYALFESKGFSANRTTLSILRRYRLAGLTRLAEMGLSENARVSRELERVRIATILTPVCALVISVLTYLFF